MDNVHKLVLKRLFISWILLSLSIGGIDLYLEMEDADSFVINLAMKESESFTSENLHRINLPETDLSTLRQKAAEFLESHFVVVELYNRDKKKLLEEMDPGKEFLEKEIRKHTHAFPLGDTPYYRRLLIGESLFMQVLMPLREPGGAIAGYFEGVYQVDAEMTQHIKSGVTRALLLVVAVTLITTMALYPVILSFHRRLVWLNRNLEGQVEARTADLQRANLALTKANEQIRQEMEIAEGVFARLFEGGGPSLPGLRYFHRFLGTAGGDLLLTAETADGRRLVLVGDVTGHGLSAALVAMPIAEVFQRLAEQGAGLEVMIATLNRFLHERLPTGFFLAAALAEIHPEEGKVIFWNGGLPAALVGRPGGLLRRLVSRNLALGITADHSLWENTETFTAQAGERLFIHTDGVTEAASPAGEHFGEERLAALISDSAGEEDFIAQLEIALNAHSGNTFADDVTLVEIPISL
ncbi:MAG: serine/threonine-protein phosphatase [Sulfuricella sp.]|nr:serine/threonine-protein phosphatase [Sulfuricella sp.]